MIEFLTQEVIHSGKSIEAACLTTDPGTIQDERDNFVVDEQELFLPTELAVGIVEAIRTCHVLEQARFGVDCAVFGALVLGGKYSPVSDEIYRRGLRRTFTFGRWLQEEEIFGASSEAELVQFIRYTGRPLPVHTAVKLPGKDDLYIQKIGHNLPIAITSAIPNLKFHGGNTIATVNEIRASYNSVPVLTYRSSGYQENPVDGYTGLPG